MPTPYGFRGGMAFGAGELRVLRRALALALQPSSATVQDVQDCHRLAESVDDAARESARFRAFLLADLARYRAALPGGAHGYLALLNDALDAAYRPEPADLAALRSLRHLPAAAALLDRCGVPVAPPRPARADEGTRDARPDERAALPAARAGDAPVPSVPQPQPQPQPPALAVVPPSRRRLLALPGGLAPAAPERTGTAVGRQVGEAAEPAGSSEKDAEPAPEPAADPERPAAPDPEPAEPAGPGRGPDTPNPPGRPVPTPAEVFPPKRRPAPPANPPQQLAAG